MTEILGGCGTRVEIVNWLEEHFGAYLKTKPNWRGNLTNLNKQGFLNKYWTREEIGISENGRTKYLYRIVGGLISINQFVVVVLTIMAVS